MRERETLVYAEKLPLMGVLEVLQLVSHLNRRDGTYARANNFQVDAAAARRRRRADAAPSAETVTVP